MDSRPGALRTLAGAESHWHFLWRWWSPGRTAQLWRPSNLR